MILMRSRVTWLIEQWAVLELVLSLAADGDRHPALLSLARPVPAIPVGLPRPLHAA